MKRYEMVYEGGHNGELIEAIDGEWVSFKDAENLKIQLLDYFASKAMQAAATNPVGAEGFTFQERAAWAYLQADAMLVERVKRTADQRTES